MSHMIAELLDFTRARLGGGFALQLARVDLSEICHGIVDELRVASSAEIVQTKSGDVTGLWDAGRMAEVVSNIVGNIHCVAAARVERTRAVAARIGRSLSVGT